jgi:hypothetical protein
MAAHPIHDELEHFGFHAIKIVVRVNPTIPSMAMCTTIERQVVTDALEVSREPSDFCF